MKKPCEYLWLRQTRLARYGLRKQHKRKNRRRVSPSAKYVRPGELIKAPVKFNLTRGAGVEVVKFLRAVAHRVLVDQKPVRLDFRKTESFFVPGAILLTAELNRIVATSTIQKPISILDPQLRRPREVMKQVGIHQITADRCDIIPTRDDVVYWRATKGADQSGDKLAILESVAERANSEHARQVELSDIWRGVSEAVANTVDHAYAIPRKDGFPNLDETKWWMFTQIRNGQFTAAVCDLGSGYRSTINRFIPEKFIMTWQKILHGHNTDASAIQTAMEYGRSGTREDNRGKGSRDALSVLEKHGAGQLYILSNTGCVRYTYNDGEHQDVDLSDLGIDIQGTIIWWNLPLMRDEHVDG